MKSFALLGLAIATAASAVLAPSSAAQERIPSAAIVTPTPTPGLRPPDAPRLPYVPVQAPAAPPGSRFGNVTGVALTPAGTLIVLNRNFAYMMCEYDASGRLLRTFNPNIAGNPHGLRVDRHGNIWLTDSFLNLVWKLDDRGQPLRVLGTRGEVGPWREEGWNGMFNQPLDVAFDADDNVYVVQGHGGTAEPAGCTFCATYRNTRPSVEQGSDARILKFDRDLNFVSSRPLRSDDGTYPFIHTVIVTSQQEVWVGDRQANRILVFDRELTPKRVIAMPNRPSGLFMDAQNTIWMSSGMDGMIMRLDSSGRITGWFGEGGRTTDPASTLIGEAHYLAVSADQSTIFVADSINSRVHRFAPR